MANKYETQLGVKFGDKHSFRDFGLYPKTKMIVDPPDVREVYVEVAGADGDLDLTEALTGRANYDSRKGKFEFTVIDRARWDSAYAVIMNEVHGRKMRVVLDEDPNYYYEGRVKVNSFKTNKRTGTITLEGRFYPYKRALYANSTKWLWDPFNFETDIARDYENIFAPSDEYITVTVVGSRMPVTPVFNAERSMNMRFNGVTYSLEAGRNRIPSIILEDQEYEFEFKGNSNVSIEFEVGSL